MYRPDEGSSRRHSVQVVRPVEVRRRSWVEVALPPLLEGCRCGTVLAGQSAECGPPKVRLWGLVRQTTVSAPPAKRLGRRLGAMLPSGPSEALAA